MNSRAIALGVVMDPIAKIKIYKDTTFAMLLAAQARGWQLWYMEQADLVLRGGEAFASARPLRVRDDSAGWFDWDPPQEIPLQQLDVILMRKDPPFDTEYIFTTHLLDLAQKQGSLVVNSPQSLRDANEKLFIAHFPRCIPPTLVTRDMGRLRDFLRQQQRIVLKPLDGMGGAMVFHLTQGDPNTGVVLETLTGHGRRYAMAQLYLPQITETGDRRILLVDGEPFPYALARIPAEGEGRGNLAVGGKGVGSELTERDRWLCQQLAPELRRRGLLFVGVDVIGDYLTEINVTSPTCIRELDAIYDADIGSDLMAAIERRL